MKKKTFIVQMLDSKKPSKNSFTQVEDALFYSNDTDASLVFIPHEDTFDFQTAKVVMFNRGDESLVERDMEVTTEDGRKVASYELPDEIISHWGQWIAQPVFINDDEIYSGAIVPFSVDRHLMHERPPKLTEVVTVTRFVQQSQELVNAMIQAEAQRITEEQARQSAESVRVQAEQERVQGYQEIQQIIEDGSLIAEPADGSLTTEKFANDSVTPDKTTFFDLSSNIYDDETAFSGYALDESTGQMVENASYITGDLIRVVPNEIYSTKRFNKVLYYDENRTYINRYNHLDGTGATFTPPTDAYYVRLQYTIGSTQNGEPQINRGGTLLPYDEFFQKVKNEHISVNESSLLDNSVTTEKVKDGSITPEKTKFFKFSTNLFNKNDVMLGKTVDGTTGAINDHEVNFVSGKIMLIPETQYTLNSPSTRLTIYDKNDVRLSTHLTNSNTDIISINTHPDTSYGRVSGNEGRIPILMLNSGETPLPYEEYHEPYIPDEYLAKISDIPEAPTQSKPYYLAPNSPTGTIDPTDSVEALDGTGASGYNNLDISVSDVYGWYDALVSTYPNYVSREQIGTDASDQYPIYAYTFDANNMLETPNKSSYKPKPKLILGTGMHGRANMGDPNNSIYSLHWFMKDICEQNQSSEWFSYLRNSVTFKIIPLQNPWAVQNATRKNSNGVDINRNFDTPTWRSGEPTATDYGGAEPFSEPESRALRDYVIANDDAKLVMDFHTVGTLYEHGKWMYFDFPTGSEVFNIANAHVKTMSSKWKTKSYPLDDSEYYGYVHNTLAGKYQEWVNNEIGILSAVLEGAPHIPNTDEPRDSQTVMDMYYDSMSNWVAHFVKHL